MKLLDANREMLSAIYKPYIWAAFAWEELKDRYKRSVIGVLWIPLSFLVFVGVKVLVFSKLNQVGLDVFTVHVVVGYWIWQAMSAIMVDSCSVFVRSAGYIKSSPLPYSVYILQALFRNSVPFFYNFLIVVGLCWAVSDQPIWKFVYVIPAFLIFALNGIWLGMFLGVLAARFRDIMHFIQTIMRVLFFMTPIIWMPEQLGRLGFLIALYNPFSHFIQIIRAPVAGEAFPMMSWAIVIALTIVGWILGLYTYSRTRSSIVHWI